MIGRFLAVIVGIAGAVGASQAPNYANNYMQNLEGRVDELRGFATTLEADRSRLGISPQMAKAACDAADNESLKSDCTQVETTLDRYQTLVALQESLRAASEWERPILIARGMAKPGVLRDIGENVMVELEPAVPTTGVGIGYAAGGGLSLWALASLLFSLIGLPFRPRYA